MRAAAPLAGQRVAPQLLLCVVRSDEELEDQRASQTQGHKQMQSKSWTDHVHHVVYGNTTSSD